MNIFTEGGLYLPQFILLIINMLKWGLAAYMCKNELSRRDFR